MEQNSSAVKMAKPDHPVHDLIVQRWSPRAYDARPVEAEKLRSILEAAGWSASSGNGQPWSFLIATQEQTEAFAAMVGCLMDGNAPWASKAPILGMVVTAVVRPNGNPNRHAFYDAGLAMQNLSLQATALGLALRQMGGFHPDKAREVFQIPETHEPVAMFALGYPGDPNQLDERQREQELAVRERRPLDEFVFTGGWDVVSPIVAD